jgi:hypothetical protein
MTDLSERIQADYERLHQVALKDPQKAGHGSEAMWAELLDTWLPPNYEVATRKYIVPETGDDSFETDIVIFRPGSPRPMRASEEVLAGVVAAAFSAKLTLDRAGVKDGVDRALRLRRAMLPREGSLQSELLPAFPVGLLAHSHRWPVEPADGKGNVFKRPEVRISKLLQQEDAAHVSHPAHTIDLVCVADLATWVTRRMTYLPPAEIAFWTAKQQQVGAAVSSIACTLPVPSTSAFANTVGPQLDDAPMPIAALITALLIRLSYDDPALIPLATSLRANGNLGSVHGSARFWELDAVYSRNTLLTVPRMQTGVFTPGPGPIRLRRGGARG